MMLPDARRRALEDLFALRRPAVHLARALDAFPFECDDADALEFRAHHAEGVLMRYIAGELRERDLEEWATLIEGREDVRYEAGAADALSALVVALAHPTVAGPMTLPLALGWVQRLRAGAQN